MKKIALFVLSFCFVTAVANTALALRWPDNMSRLVETMGGAFLAIEDETTALTPFNHQNVAGAALLKKMDRIDVGIGYDSDLYKIDYEYSIFLPLSGTTTIKTTSETKISGLKLTRPGAEFRGITYWLNDNTLIRAGVEALSWNWKDDFNYEATDSTGTTAFTSDDTFGITGLGANASFCYKTDMGLTVGAGLSYKGAGGKPGDLEEGFNVFGNNSSGNPQTTKLEANATNLDWAVGAVFALPDIGGEDNKLTFGLSAHADDDMPDFASIIGLSIAPSVMGDFSSVINLEGDIEGLGVVTETYTYTLSPMVISAEAIFDVGSMLAAGILFDTKSSSMNTKEEYTGYPTGITQNVDYKNADISITGITPVIAANIPVGEDFAVLGGLMFSTWGSGKTDNYDLDPTTTDINDTYKDDVDETSSSLIAIGAGVQAMGKQLQLNVQYETGAIKMDDTNYDTNGAIVQQTDKNGNLVNIITSENTISNVRFGAEFRVMPVLALRAGYAILAATTKDGFFDLSTTPVSYKDLIITTNRITLGAGMNLTQGTAIDLLVRIDSKTRAPEYQDITITDSAMAVLLGAKIPL